MGLDLPKYVDVISDIIFAAFCVIAAMWIMRNWR